MIILVPSLVFSADFNLSKLRINLNQKQKSDFLILKNDSAFEKEAYEISVLKWTQEELPNGQLNDVLKETNDIIVSPKTLVVSSKSEKIIRIIMNSANNYDNYRLVINQLPKQNPGSM